MRHSASDKKLPSGRKTRMLFMNMLRQLAIVILLGCFGVSRANAEISVFEIDIGLPHTTVFMVSGPFDGKEILKLKAAIAGIPAQKRIVVLLDSPGGLVAQGAELGEYFGEGGKAVEPGGELGAEGVIEDGQSLQTMGVI